MIWPWGILGYALVAFGMTRVLAGHFAYIAYMRAGEYRSPDGYEWSPDGYEWFGSIAGAAVLSIVWPCVVAYLLAGNVLPKVGAEREAERRQMKARIEQLEREAGL